MTVLDFASESSIGLYLSELGISKMDMLSPEVAETTHFSCEWTRTTDKRAKIHTWRILFRCSERPRY
jgi:hypothetical protein